MKSAMCSGGHHENCHVTYQQLSGKKFRCDCTCHVPVKVYRQPELDDEEDDANSQMTAAEVRAWAEAEYHRNRAAEQRGEADRVRLAGDPAPLDLLEEDGQLLLQLLLQPKLFPSSLFKISEVTKEKQVSNNKKKKDN